MVTTTTDPHAALQQPVVTSSKVNAGAPVLKTTLGGQGKKLGGKGKVKPTDKGKKPAVKTDNIMCNNFSWSFFKFEE